MGRVWDHVVGQPAAMTVVRAMAAHPGHAYLFVGPPGSTKHEAARALAVAIITGSDDDTSRDARLAFAGAHPDIAEFEREGARLSIEEARDIVRRAGLAPVEADRKVIIINELHLLRPEAAAALLKTLEEPPESTTFIILAEYVPTEMVTIASRCSRIDFRPITTEAIADRLVYEGVDPASALEAATSANGDLTKARLLAADPELGVRRRAFAAVPGLLDGTGATVISLAEGLIDHVDVAVEPLVARQRQEIADLDAMLERFGERRGGGKKQLEDRHKRELRRYRTDILRDGLGVMAGVYRDALLAGAFTRSESAEEAVAHIHRSIGALDRNPNESLLVQSLIWSLPPISGAAQIRRSVSAQ